MTNAPRAFIAFIKSYFFTGVSSMACHHRALALFTRMSTRPKRFTAATTHASHACASRRSHTTARARAPVLAPTASISAATVCIVQGSVFCGVADFAATTTSHH